ncbi:unnamed protein product [Strongylus vulgaris]|uniref:Uncharacterized protein n=1 Tax=Strongylus vulgaris TaxID=40348 RepID=A0A3P7J9R5_STRVU|nr:unnamed protein product [Strongylus vulgaris]
MEEGSGGSECYANHQFEFHEFIPSGSQPRVVLPNVSIVPPSTLDVKYHLASESAGSPQNGVKKQELQTDEKHWWNAAVVDSDVTVSSIFIW